MSQKIPLNLVFDKNRHRENTWKCSEKVQDGKSQANGSARQQNITMERF